MTGAVFPGIDPATGMFSLPWWAAAIIAAFTVVCFVVAITRIGVVRLVAVLGAIAALSFALWGGWTLIDRSAQREHAAARQVLSVRALELTTRSVAPGSVLACLDGGAGETVEASCEKMLFATPATVAAATAYVGARLAILSDAAGSMERIKAEDEGPLSAERRALETDRFGFVAQVLATAYNCSAENCGAFALFRDTEHLKENLRDRIFDGFVARNSTAWPARVAAPATAAAGPPNAVALNPNGPSPVPPGFNVPSAASIPPVNIMAAEPPPAAAAETPPAPHTAPAKRPVARTRPAAANTLAPPVQIVPPGATAATAPPRAQ